MPAISNFWAYLSFFSVFIFIFIGQADFPYLGGDDVFLITPEFVAPYLRSLYSGNFLDIIQNRRLLHLAYYFVYKISGSNLIIACWILSSFLLFSTMLLWKTLQKLFSTTAAFLGALFFLVYAGKLETLGLFQAMLYHVVIFLMILIIWTFLTFKRSSFLRFGLIAALLWFSLLLYEVLIVLVPLIILATIFEIKPRTAKALLTQKFFLSFFVAIPASVHIFLISLSANPIWNRIESESSSVLDRILKIPRVIRWGLETTFGGSYWHTVYYSTLSFLKDTISNNAWIIFIIIFCIFCIYKTLSIKPLNKKAHTEPRVGYLLFILFSIAFSLIITLTVANGFVSTRFSYVPSVFLSIIICIGLDWHWTKNKETKRQFVYFIVLILIAINAFASSSIGFQFGRAGRLDHKIHNSLKEKLPRLENGAQILAIIPFNPQDPYWTNYRVVGARYHVSPTASLIWGLNPHMTADIPYKGIPTKPGWEEHLFNYLKHMQQSLSNTYCFNIDPNFEARLVNEFQSSAAQDITFRCHSKSK